MTTVIRERAAGSFAESDVSWTFSELDPSPWQVPAIVSDVEEELESLSGLPLYVDFTRLTGGWFWPVYNGDSSVRIYSTLNAVAGQEASLGVAVEGSYEIRVNGNLAARQESAGGTLVINDLSAFIKPGANSLELAVVNRAPIAKMAVAGFTNIDSTNFTNYSVPEAWGVGGTAIRYEDFSETLPESSFKYEDFAQRLPQIAQIPGDDNWLQTKYQASQQLIRFVTVLLFTAAVLACYRVLYGTQTVLAGVSAVGVIAHVGTLFWWLLLFCSSFLSMDVNHIYFGAHWLSGVALFFALLLRSSEAEIEQEALA